MTSRKSSPRVDPRSIKDKFDSEEKSKTVKQIAQLQDALKDREKETKTKNGAPTPDGPGRDLKTLELKQQDLQTKLTTLGNQIWQLLQREVRGFEEDKAECENKKSKPELLVDLYELRRELNQSEQTRPVRDLIRQKDMELTDLKKRAAKPYHGGDQGQDRAVGDGNREFPKRNRIGHQWSGRLGPRIAGET